MKKFVFIDIDGTLYDHNNHIVPPSAIEALRKAKDNGHELFICTGRPKPVVESSYLKLPISGAVFAGGTHIEVDGKVIYQGQFPYEQIEAIVKYMKSHDIEFTLEGVHRNYYTNWTYDYFKTYFCDQEGADLEMIRKFEERRVICDYEDYTSEDAAQVAKIDLFALNNDDIREYMKTLPENVEGFLYTSPIGDRIEGEILIQGVSKASGIDKVIQYFGGKLEDTIAIGDSTNDLPMIEHAALSIAMGNACDPLKEAADYVSADVSEDGLAQAFKYAGLI